MMYNVIEVKPMVLFKSKTKLFGNNIAPRRSQGFNKNLSLYGGRHSQHRQKHACQFD